MWPCDDSVNVGALDDEALPMDADDPLTQIQSRIDSNEFDEAVDLAEELIQRIENEKSQYDLDLVQPLVLLGEGSRKNKDYVGALNAFDRARQVSRLANGLHSLEQVDIVYREADTYYELGQVSRANDRQEYAFSIYARSYESESVDLLPGLFSLADWYVEMRNIFAARGLYYAAMKISESNLEQTDPRNIRALKGLASTYRLERWSPPGGENATRNTVTVSSYPEDYELIYKAVVNDFAPGEEALKDLVKIEMEREGSTQESIANAKLELADWFLLFYKFNQAEVVYKNIWEMFENDSNSEYLSKEFSEPVPLFYPLARSPGAQPAEALSTPIEGILELSFSVSEEGDVEDIEVLSVEPNDKFLDDFVDSMELARYRPAMIDGVAERREGVIFTHSYIYFPNVDADE